MFAGTHSRNTNKAGVILLVLIAELLSLPLQLEAKDVNILIYGPATNQAGIDIQRVAGHLEGMFDASPAWQQSSCTAYSRPGVESLVEAYHDPTHQADTLSQLEGGCDYVVLVPNNWFIRRYPEMTFEGVFQMSRHILNAGAQPVLLMGDPKIENEVETTGSHVYRVANGCGILASPAGYAMPGLNLIAASGTEQTNRQTYLIAAVLFHQITGQNAGDLNYRPVEDAASLASAASATLTTHRSLKHYQTSRHNQGIIRYRNLDLNASPFDGTARYAYKGTSTENGISNHLKPILQANGYTVESKLISSSEGGTKEWTDADVSLSKDHFNLRQNQMFLCYARGAQSGADQMINDNQAHLSALTFDRHYDNIGTGLASTQNMLDDIHARNWSMFLDHFYYQWNTVPYHIGVARLYQADPSMVASTDGVHASTPCNNLLASMVLSTTLGRQLSPSSTIQNNPQSLLAFEIGQKLIKQLAYLSEDSDYVPDSSIQVVTESLGQAYTNHAYSRTLQASGGTTPYRWQLVSGTDLPEGLTLSEQGELQGTPTGESRAHIVAVKVTDASGAIRKRALRLLIQNPMQPSYDAWAEWIFDGSGYSLTAYDRGKDPDGDGMNNFLEFAIGGDPTKAESLSWFEGIDANKVYLSFQCAQPHLRYRVEYSPDLLTWNSVVWDSNEQDDHQAELYDVRSMAITRPATTGFYRLLVSEP